MNLSCRLLCNVFELPITANLDEALRHLRKTDEKRYVWIDAVCISQVDPIEKARQIGNLLRIFRKASRVVIWLGEETEGSTSGGLFVIDDLLRARATELVLKDKPMFYYPSTGTEYLGYSPSDLYQLSHQAATFYNALIPRRTSSDEAPQVLALLGPSTLECLISVIALGKVRNASHSWPL